MPTVKSVRATCDGSYGKPSPTILIAMMSSIEVTTRAKNRYSEIDSPPMMRRPSVKAGSNAANESFSRIISATLRVTLLPLSIAMPSLAFLSDSASFTPSPIMAT